MTLAFTISTAALDQLILEIRPRHVAAVDQCATDVQQLASQLAPRDTGSLAESIYVNNGTNSDYPSRSALAHGLNPTAVIEQEIDPSLVISLFGSSSNAYISVVGVAVAHGIFQELGTRYQSPQPFLLPAAEQAKASFISNMSHVADVP